MKLQERRMMKCIAAGMAVAVAATSVPVTENVKTVSAAQSDVPVKEDVYTVTSPEGELSADFWLDEKGTPMYEISYDGKQVIEASAMGFELKVGEETVNLTDGFEITETETRKEDTTWENPFGDLKVVPDKYEELTLRYDTEEGIPVDVVCRAYEEGIAFRYNFPQNEEISEFQILQEKTYFNLDNTATAYVHIDRNQTEVTKIPVPELKAEKEGYYRPLTLIGDGYAMTMTEANQVDYTRVHYTVEEGGEAGTLRTIFNGYSDNEDLLEEHVADEVSVDVSKEDFATSWRTFVIGENEGEVLDNNYLVKNLNPACVLDDISWITPGKAVRAALNTEKGKTAIDFAVEHKLQYVHFDAGWYGPEGNMSSNPWKHIDALDLEEVSAYANEKGIKLVLYVNYRHLEDQYQKGQLNDLFKMYVDEWGVDGIKFGFVPVGSQASTKMVYEWVKIAADNHLIVDIHDEMLPTGYERTYPNLLTLEGIHGDEENPTPKNDLGYLFTRMVAGQADHTWCFNRGDRNTTKAFRIAGSLVFFSPLVYPYWYDDGALGTMNTFGTGLWDTMPTTWDESHTLDAKIEEYSVVARRNGTDWYIAGISASDAYELNVPLSMLEEGTQYKAEIYTNKPGNIKEMSVQTCLVTNEDTLSAILQNNYGYAVKLSPAEEGEELPVYAELNVAAQSVKEKIANLPEITPDNVTAVRTDIEAIRAEYNALDELQKIIVSNLSVLDKKEAEAKRITTSPVEKITINGEALENFSPETENYTVTLMGGAPLPQVSVYPHAEAEIVEIKQVENIPGIASVTVKNEFITKTYTIEFTIPDGDAEVYASDYTDYTMDGRKEFKKDANRGGGPLTLYNAEGVEETFAKGIGTHAATNIYFNVEGQGITRFQAYCGVSSVNGKDNNNVRFKVYKDERTAENLLFDSEVMQQKTPYKRIDVDTTGAKVIILEANDGGDGISNDHANWCDAKFIIGEVFMTPIDEMIAGANALLETMEDEEQKAIVEEAVLKAEQVKETEEITYEMVYAAAVELRNVIAAFRQEQKEELQSLIEKAEVLEKGGRTFEEWKGFLAAFNEAKQVVADLNADEARTEEVLQKLKAAIAALPADYTAVEEAIAKAEALNRDLYKDLSDVDKAIAAVEKDLTIEKQAEVDAFAKAITDAIAALEYKDADYTAVEEAIAKAEALNKEDYKDFSKVEAAIEAVVEGKNITEQAEVDAFAKAIEDAIAALEKVEPKFTDVREGDWYYDYVMAVSKRGYMTGMDDTYFGAQETLVRAQFAVILYRIAGEPEVDFKDKFADVKDGHFYSDAVTWAQENNIMTGYDDTGLFGPNDMITREQMAAVMFRYAQTKEEDLSTKGSLNAFPDAEKVQDFAVEAVKWCVEQKIITGQEEPEGNILNPQGATLRAECAAIIERFAVMYE